MPEIPMRIAGKNERSIARKINFTVAAMESVKVADGRDRVWVYDTKTPGLGYMLTAGGAAAFYVYRRANGRPQRVRLGGFPEITIEQARKLAAKTNLEIAAGKDPMAEKQSQRIEQTIGGLFGWYIENYAKVHKKSWQADHDQYDRCLIGWASRRLSAVKQADVATLHAKIGAENGHYTANRLLALLSKMFNEGRRIGFEGINPAHGVRKFKEQSRERFVQPDELPRFFAALEHKSTPPLFRDFFKLALLTGARRSNVQAMAWEHVSFGRATWIIPDDQAKAGSAITVPLSPPVMQILKALHHARDKNNPWVFPSRGVTGHLVEPKTAWKRILKRAGLSDLRLHDLRRTLGSWQAAAGASLPIIGKSLGHKSQATTAIYARLNLDPARASVNTATAAMLKTVKAAKRRRSK